MGERNTEIPGGTQAGSFVSPVVREDIARAIVASHRDGPRRMLGIRGLNPIDDFVQQKERLQDNMKAQQKDILVQG